MSHPTLSSTRCELQWAAWRCSGVTPSLMRSDCQLRAFNAEVTGSCTIALSPCFHSCPTMLVPSFGGWRGWLRWIAYYPFFSGQESPRTRCSSAISPSSCGPSLVILGHFLIGWALGLIIRNGPRRPDPLAPHIPYDIIINKCTWLVWLKYKVYTTILTCI